VAAVIPNSTAAYVAELQRREHLALRARVLDMLEAESLPDLAPILRRDRLADAAAILLREARSFGEYVERPEFALRSPPPWREQRMAACCGVITNQGLAKRGVLTLHDLQRIAGGRNRKVAKRARLALAFLGEIDWRQATRAERAAFIWGRLVLAARAT
jgi:hypothetical protein